MSAGIMVRLPDSEARPARGSQLEVTGTLADPYGQLELRGLTALRVVGTSAAPAPVSADGASVGEVLEARLVVVAGTVDGKPARTTSGDLTLTLATIGGVVRVAMDASANIPPSSVSAGDRIRVTGVVGQHASRKGAADGYRVWARDRADLVREAAAGSSPTPSAGTSTPSGGSSSAIAIAIASASSRTSGTVTVVGVISIKPTLLDASGRRVVVQDSTGAVE